LRHLSGGADTIFQTEERRALPRWGRRSKPRRPTTVDPADKSDHEKAIVLQDAIKIDRPGGPGKYEVPNWDLVSQMKVRDTLLVLATRIVDTSKAFGTKDQVVPVQRLIGRRRPGEPIRPGTPPI